MKIEAILAHDSNYVIGQGDSIPWHHTGDFKRFKKITDGHHLLMGVKTYLGIAKNFMKEPGLQVLPGRQIFVLGTPRSCMEETYYNIHRRGFGIEWVQLVNELQAHGTDLGIDMSNVRVIVDNESADEILSRIYSYYHMKHEKLFIAGGAKIYDKFIRNCDTIHRTIIQVIHEDQPDLVKMTPATIDYLTNFMNFGCVEASGSETSNGLEAYYQTMHR